jgi:hypothetical protein
MAKANPGVISMIAAKMTTARWVGVTYLFLIATGIFSLAYAPGQYFVRGDEAATFAKLQGNLVLFKSAIVAEMACYASFVLLVSLLHRLFREASETLALVMVGFVLVSVPISFIAIAEKMAVLELVSQGAPQGAAVLPHFGRYNDILDPAQLFWGLWLLPYGLLVLKTRTIPRFFGIALILGCCSYVAGVIVPIFWEGYSSSPIGRFAGIPGTIGEIGGALWLTVFGARAFWKRETAS